MARMLSVVAQWLGELEWQAGRRVLWLGRQALRVPVVVWFWIFVTVMYAGSVVRDFHLYQYLINPDGISYMDIARLYADGRWGEAVNAYWGPLLSWLMVPAVKLGLEPLGAVKLVNLAVGFGLIVGVYRLARRALLQDWAMVVTALAGMVVYAWAMGGYVTPDLLLTTLVMWYMVLLTSPRLGQTWWPAVGAGLLAGGAYLAKSYALPFFLLHFSLYIGWRWWRERGEGRRWQVRYLLGLAGFFALAAPWVAAISFKEGRLTYGTSGAYTLTLVAPNSPGHPVLNAGLIPPPAGGTSAWMDPEVPDVPSWLPQLFPRPHNLGYTRDVITENWGMLLKVLNTLWPLALGAIVAALALTFRRAGTLSPEARFMTKFAVFSGFMYVSGYLLIFVEDRYIWLLVLLAVLLAGVVLERVWRDRTFPKWVALGLLAVVYYTLAPQPAQILADRKNANSDMVTIARQIKAIPGYDCRSLASNGYWEITSYLAFYLDCPYYGMFGPYDIAKTDEQLAKHKVEYVLMWTTGDPKRDERPKDYAEVGEVPQKRVKVLKYDPPKAAEQAAEETAADVADTEAESPGAEPSGL